MLRNNVISFIANFLLGFVALVLTVIICFGGFNGSGDYIVESYRIYFALVVFLVGSGVLFYLGTLLKEQGSKIMNILSLSSPIIWIGLGYVLSSIFLKGEPRSYIEVLISVSNLSNITYPILKFIDFSTYSEHIRIFMIAFTTLLPTFLMWLGMEYRKLINNKKYKPTQLFYKQGN